MTKHFILVRFNHDAKSENERWRFVWNNIEHVCASVTFQCPTETCKQEIEIDHVHVTKWHIRPIAPKAVEYIEKEGAIHFTVK